MERFVGEAILVKGDGTGKGGRTAIGGLGIGGGGIEEAGKGMDEGLGGGAGLELYEPPKVSKSSFAFIGLVS